MDSGLAELVPDISRTDAWILYVDGTPQSQVDLDDPTYLEFEYVRRLAHIVDLAAPEGEPLRVLHLGGGGLTLPRYITATRPGSSQLVAEADGSLMDLVRRFLPLPRTARRPSGHSGPNVRGVPDARDVPEVRGVPGVRGVPDSRGGPGESSGSSGRSGRGGPGKSGRADGTGKPGGYSGRGGRIRVRISDARQVLETVPADSFDLVISDVFAGGQTPAHLTTVECARAAARVLRPGGIYAVNVADGTPLTHARGQVATIRAVFRYGCMLAEPGVLRGRRFGNLVMAGSHSALPVADLTRRAAADPFPARVVSGAELDRFASGAQPVTDAMAGPSPAPGQPFGAARGRHPSGPAAAR